MRKSRFSEHQFIGVLKNHEEGAWAEDLCRRYGISGTAFYKWTAKFGGMEKSEATRLKTLYQLKEIPGSSSVRGATRSGNSRSKATFWIAHVRRASNCQE